MTPTTKQQTTAEAQARERPYAPDEQAILERIRLYHESVERLLEKSRQASDRCDHGMAGHWAQRVGITMLAAARDEADLAELRQRTADEAGVGRERAMRRTGTEG